MPLRLMGSAEQVAAAIDEFPHQYHEDYENVRREARVFLAGRNNDRNAIDVAVLLRAALISWGAGRRSAPCVQAHDNVVSALLAEHQTLNELSQYPIKDMSHVNSRRVFLSGKCVETYDALVLGLIRRLASTLFQGNTNVTYPMKAALLLTGAMPAFDSQVRKGLQRAGMKGFSSTQFGVPTNDAQAGARRIVGIPFDLGAVWTQNIGLLESAVRSSGRIDLLDEPGRLFDVLLFVQGSSDRILLRQSAI